MTSEFLIDGYNLMHAAGLARPRYGPGDLERARDRLLKRLHLSLADTERHRVTVVFDAQDVDRAERQIERSFGMIVLFSPAGRQADDVIEDLLASHSSPKQVLVVSSDHRLHRAARARRARCIDSDAFLDALDRIASRAVPPQPEKPDIELTQDSETPSLDMQPWLNEFSDINIAGIIQEVEAEERRTPKASPIPPPATPAKSSDSKPTPPSAKPPVGPAVAANDASQHNTASSDLNLADIIPEELSFWEKRVAELFEKPDANREQ